MSAGSVDRSCSILGNKAGPLTRAMCRQTGNVAFSDLYYPFKLLIARMRLDVFKFVWSVSSRLPMEKSTAGFL